MGLCANKQIEVTRKNLHDLFVVATLNYGGILNSPFEFYSNEQS